MQRKILLNLLAVSICGIVLSTIVFFAIQTVAAQKSVDEVSLARMDDAEGRILSNNRKLEDLIEIVREDNLSRARALAMLIEMEPDIIEDAYKLGEIAAAMGLEEIHIIDENGILQWGTQPFKYGMDFSQKEQTRPFLAILEDPSIEISQSAMPNASLGVIRQYAGVSLRHAKGIAEVGIIPTRLLEAVEDAHISNVLRDLKLGNSGYMFSISTETGLITSHPNPDLVGMQLTNSLQPSGFMNINGQNIRYHIRETQDEILVTAFPTAEMYQQRTLSTGLFLLFIILLFILFCVIINSYISRTVVTGIHDIIGVLDKITDGDLNATVDVRSNTEFNRLSDGINHMLSSINNKISEVSDAMASAEEAMTAAEEASHAKSFFLANMSHEIRTPMNGIIGMTDLLMGESMSERQSQYVRDIKMSAESLLGIINDILDLSKINEGRLQIMPVDIDLSTMLKNVVSMLGFSARSKNLNFIDDIQLNIPEYVRVDDVRLNQIIVNLLSNAIKFTKTGHVKLLVKIEDGKINIAVSDTGTGILPEDLPLIFIPFEQADKHKNRAIKGTGLGLSITKNLVEMMGGNIWAESEYGVGTVFHVTLPYVPGDESAVEVIDTEFRYIFAPTARILLVDDIQTNLTVGSGLLRMCGITADVAMSGHEAIELVNENDYDIVFMDHMMPEMDGIEAMTLIRALGGKYRELPIIALTANAVNESRDLLLSSGMDDFLSKPIDKASLMNILQKWLPADKVEADSKPANSQLSAPYSEVLVKASKINGLDIELALSRISGMQDVLETSLRQTAFAIEGQLKKIDDFITNRNFHSLAIEAHGLKGALSNIGAMRHSELAAELEIASKAENMPLCTKSFTVFADVMQSFANELKSLFPKSEIESRPPGEKSFLELKIREAIEYLESFEATDALDCLNALSDFTFGSETDSGINEAKTATEAYNYEKAVSLLKNI